MKLLLIPIFVVIFGCTNQVNTVVEKAPIDADFVFMNSLTGDHLQPVDDLEMRLFVTRDLTFENRFDQVQHALDITGYSINDDMSVLSLKKMSPSPYLQVNKLMSVKQYLRLSGASNSKVVVDPVHKLVFYTDAAHLVVFVDNLKKVDMSTMALSDDVDASDLGKVDMSTSAMVPPFINVPDEAILSNDEQSFDPENLALDTDENPSLTEPVVEVISVEDDLTFTLSESDDVTVGISHAIDVKSGDSLRDIFKSIADLNQMVLINSMGVEDWFLNSQINHDYTFDNLEDALTKVLAEANHILQIHNINFSILASNANNVIEVYYETY